MGPEKNRRTFLRDSLATMLAVATGQTAGRILTQIEIEKKEEKESEKNVEDIDFAIRNLSAYLVLESEISKVTNGQGEIYLSQDNNEENNFLSVQQRSKILFKILEESLTMQAIKKDAKDYSSIFRALFTGGNMDIIRIQQFNELFKELTDVKNLELFKKAISNKIYFENYFKEHPIILPDETYQDDDGLSVTKVI